MRKPAEPISQPVLSVRGLKTEFPTRSGLIRAVDDVSFDVMPGETVGVVGESGCGKSMTALSLMRLVQPPGRIVAGQVLLHGQDVLTLSEREMQRIRGSQMAMIFQDPLTTLNPVLTVGEQIAEMLRLHGLVLGAAAGSPVPRNPRQRAKWAWERGLEMLDLVGIPAAAHRMDEYPHQFSGGMRQRVMIAIALACHPVLLIADEPTTALDVTIQAQILELMEELQKERGMSIILITHDFGVISEFCERVMVMYAGRVVEVGSLKDLMSDTLHPYTQGLLASIPRLDEPEHVIRPIEGTVPELQRLPIGCNFCTRCPFADEQCESVEPLLREIGPRHWVACHKV